MTNSPLGLIVLVAALSLLLIAMAPRVWRWLAFVAPLAAGFLLWWLLHPVQPQATPAGGYGAVKVTLLDLTLAPDEPLTMGGAGAMIAMATPTDDSSPPVDDIMFRLERDGSGLVLRRLGSADVIALVEPSRASVLQRLQTFFQTGSSPGPRWLGVRPLRNIGRCDSPYICTWYEQLGAWARPKRPCLAVRDGKGPILPMARGRSYQQTDNGFTWAGSGPNCPAPGAEETALMAAGTGLVQPATADDSIRIEPGDTLTFFRLLPSPPVIGDLGAESGTVERLTSLTVSLVAADGAAEGQAAAPRADRIAVRFARPPVQRFLADRLPDRLRLGSNDDVGAAATPDSEVALFRVLGRPFRADLAPVELDRRGISIANGAADASDNELRVNGERHQLRFDVVRTSFAADYAIRSLALAALAMGVVVSLRLRLASPAAAVLFGALDILLAMRLVIAAEGAISDPELAGQAYPANALLAMCALPPLLALLWPATPDGTVKGWTIVAWVPPVIALTVLIGLAAFPAAGTDAWVATAVMGVAATIWWGVRWWLARRKANPPSEQRGHDAASRHVFRTFGGAVVMAIVLVSLRIAFREAVTVAGVRIATSLLITPMTLAGFAWLFSRIASLSELGKGWNLFAFGTLLAALVVGSLAASDSGYAIMLWPVAIGAALLWAGLSDRPVPDLTAAALVASVLVIGGVLWLNDTGWHGLAVVGIAAAIVIAALWWLRPAWTTLWPLPAAGFALLAVAIALVAHLPLPTGAVGLAEANRIERNLARVYAALAPDRFATVGTRFSMEFAGVQAVVHDYATPGRPAGDGYLTVAEPVSAIHDTHQTDHVAAVHLLGPHGWLAALAVLLLEATLVIMVWRWRAPGFAGWLALLAALSIFLVSGYMVLANLGTMPFTGRNMYLLAPLSIGDVIESWLLLALITIGLRREQPE